MEIQPLAGLGVTAQAVSVKRETPALPQVSSPATPARAAAAAAPAKTPEKAQEALKEALADSIGQSPTNLRFSVDKSTGKTIVSVVDAETMEVVRQIPAEEVMKMARALDRMQGLLFNGKA